MDKERGFSTVELLAVTGIIGILAAIAVPVFLNQRREAVDRSMVADLRTIAFAQEGHLARTGSYRSSADVGSDRALAISLSPNNVGTVERDPGGQLGTFCVVVFRRPGASPGRDASRVYISDRGGVQPLGVTRCY